MKDWIPIISKLVWPVIIGLVFLIFHKKVGEVYNMAMERLQAGGSVEIGFFKFGEIAKNTSIAELSLNDVPLEVIANREPGVSRGVTKGGVQRLSALQSEIENNPDKVINTLLITDNINRYSIELLKEYVSTLNLPYVIYLKRGQFDGLLRSQHFIAQLPTPEEARVRNLRIDYKRLRGYKGVSMNKALPTATAKEVLELMQEWHTELLPVVDENEKWLYVVNREDILSNLMTSLLVSK